MSRPAAEPTPVQPEHFPRLPILVLGFAWFLAVAIELSPAGLLGAIASDLDVSVVAVGTMTTFYALGNALLVLPLTALAIRFARRTALNVVMIVFVASNVAVAALLVAPCVVAAGLAVLLLGGSNLAVVLTGIALWGIGMAATVVIYQQAILLTGHRAPETATSVGVLLAQAGFAAGSTVGGATIALFGVGTIPLVALAFVVSSVIIAITLRRVVDRASRDVAAKTAHVDKIAPTAVAETEPPPPLDKGGRPDAWSGEWPVPIPV